jgi:DNA-binding transcriptional regulator PaaX
MIIFDIPEQRREIRDFLRTKLKQLGFKKWQNSIWITPYALPSELVKELRQLSDKFFIRLIIVESINNTHGLEELFEK